MCPAMGEAGVRRGVLQCGTGTGQRLPRQEGVGRARSTKWERWGAWPGGPGPPLQAGDGNRCGFHTGRGHSTCQGGRSGCGVCTVRAGPGSGTHEPLMAGWLDRRMGGGGQTRGWTREVQRLKGKGVGFGDKQLWA